MVNNITISKANILDLEKLDKLENKLEHRILSRSNLEQNINDKNTYVLIAKIENEIIAYTSFSHLVDHIDIDSIVVDDNFRHQGIASSLLQEIFKFSSNLNIYEIFLEVRASNIAAINLYEKHGFKNIHVRKNYYPDNLEDAIICKKELA